MRHFRNFLFLAALLSLALSGYAQKTPAQKALIKRTYYDFAGRQLHEEYQYVSTPTNRFSKQGYYKEYNEDGTLWRKHQYRNNKAEGRQLEYYTTDGETWVEYDMMVHNALLNGPYIKYDGPDDKRLAGNYVNGEKAGTWIEYGSDGSQQATYYVHNEPCTGTVEERYANGKLRRSVEYYQGMRSGLTQYWFPSGQLKSQTPYRYDKPDGATITYSENSEPAEVTQAAPAKSAAAALQARADSAQNASQYAVTVRRATTTLHRADSLRFITQLEEATRAAARNQTAVAAELYQRVSYMRNAFGQYSADELGEPVYKLYHSVYSQLAADYKAATADTEQLAKVTRLVMLVNFAEGLRAGGPNGLERDLWVAIRKETNLDKILALTGL